jgi:hypothetical protein
MAARSIRGARLKDVVGDRAYGEKVPLSARVLGTIIEA